MPGPVPNPLTWLLRVFALWAFDKQLEAEGYVRGSTEAADAIAASFRLIDQGATEAEAVARLRSMPGGREALEKAAEMLARYADDEFHGRAYRLLRAASGDAA